MITAIERVPDTLAAASAVSATSMGVDVEVRGIIRPHVPNYALRRVVAGTAAVVVAMALAVGSLGLLAGFGGTPASASEAQPATPQGSAASVSMYVARPGDTLWSIASTHRGDVAHGRYLDALVRLNDGTSLQVGQAVWLP